MSRRATRSELLGADTVVLVTVQWGGSTYRLSSATVDIQTSDGDGLPYRGGLDEIEISESLSAMQAEPEYPSISVRADLGVDVALLVARGQDLSSATAEIALHIVGQAWEDREVLLVGQVVQPVYDAAGEPVAFSVESTPFDDAGLVLATTETVTATTWPTSTTDDAPYYPWVFGRPGVYVKPDGSDNVIAGSPAIAVEYTGANIDTLLVSLEAVSAGTVTIFDGTTTEVFSVAQQYDGLGRECSVVDITGAASISRTSSSYLTLWSSAGGVLNDDRSQVREGAGDVLMWMLRRSTAAIDRARFTSLRQRLNEYLIGGYVNGEARPWEWVVDHLLPILPLSIVGGPAGIYPIPWPIRAAKADAVAHIDAGDGCVRVPGITYQRTPRDVYDQIRLRFAPGTGPDAGLWGGRIILGVDPEADNSSTSLYQASVDSYQAQVAARRVAERDVAATPRAPRIRLLDSEIIWHRPTAWRVASEQLYTSSAVVRSLEYDCDARWRWLRPGQIVTLTDDEVYMTEHVAVVTGRSLGAAGGVLLPLELWESMPRDPRTAS